MQNEQLFIICVYKSVIILKKNCNAALAIMLDPYSCIYFSLGHNATKLMENIQKDTVAFFAVRPRPALLWVLNCW